MIFKFVNGDSFITYCDMYRFSRSYENSHGKSGHSSQKRYLFAFLFPHCIIVHLVEQNSGLYSSGPVQPGHGFFFLCAALHKLQSSPHGATIFSVNIFSLLYRSNPDKNFEYFYRLWKNKLNCFFCTLNEKTTLTPFAFCFKIFCPYFLLFFRPLLFRTPGTNAADFKSVPGNPVAGVLPQVAFKLFKGT